MPFSKRTAWDLAESDLSRVVRGARLAGPIIDLTEANPTRCGLSSPAAVALLGHPRGADYAPDALGEAVAREAIVADYAARGSVVDADRIVLSASTSEAYSWLFKLLCDPGDSVLVPQPSYPLFDWLAKLEGVRLAPYPLQREAGFRVDLDALRDAIEPTTRAISLVHPNNPTGTFVRKEDADAIEGLAAEHGLSLIVDEVFADYPHGTLPADRLPTFVGRGAVPTFVLSGLSKVLALPQLKLGWMVLDGPNVAEARARLEVIADTYLSVATPVQRALPELLAMRPAVQTVIRARIAANLATLDAGLGSESPIRLLASDGGWCSILEVPRTRDESTWVRTLAEEDGVLVQPGWFYDLDREGALVVSLLPEEDVFADGIGRVIARVSRA